MFQILRRSKTLITPNKHSAIRGNPQHHADVETDNYPSLQSPPLAGAGGGLPLPSEWAGGRCHPPSCVNLHGVIEI